MFSFANISCILDVSLYKDPALCLQSKFWSKQASRADGGLEPPIVVTYIVEKNQVPRTLR